MNMPQPQRGAILILVLWFTALIGLIVLTLASETRLSATAAYHNKLNLENRAKILEAFNVAQMELMVQHMPLPPGQGNTQGDLGEREMQPLYQFDGRPLATAYPLPEGVKVRIYNLSGKINLRTLSPKLMKDILRKRIGDDESKIDELYSTWQDWIDTDELKRSNGAEKDYYKGLDPPYEPRNNKLESVEELRLIKGFDEIFEGFNLEAAFTVYGNKPRINPNMITTEALSLIPRIDEEITDGLMRTRSTEIYRNSQDFNTFIDYPDVMREFGSWLDFSNPRGNQYYTIAIELAGDEGESSGRAYSVTVKYNGTALPPKILRVDPYGKLPDATHEGPARTEKPS
ncbi:MAG: hypothetical protein AAF512_16430 [Pseudomonadota bacterium]